MKRQQLGLWIAVAMFGVVLAIVYPAFLSSFNRFVLLRVVAVFAIVGFAQMANLALGEFNLPIGALAGLVVVVVGWLLEVNGTALWIALLAGLSVGIIGGAINGILTVGTGISGFVITLATAGAFYGVSLGISNASPYYDLPEGFLNLGTQSFFGLPFLFLLALAVTAVLAIFYLRLRTGRNVLSVGGNVEAAETLGLRTKRVVVLAFAMSGTLAAIAAISSLLVVGSAQPTIGSSWIMVSFAIPIIGGSAITGGDVSVGGGLAAAFLLGMINNAIVLANIDPLWVELIVGVLLFVTIVLSREKRSALVEMKIA